MGNPIIRYEAGQTARPFEALTSDDDTVFAASYAPLSNVAGAEPIVAPYGLLTGGAVAPTETNNQVAVAALTAMMPAATGADADGVLTLAGGNLLATRAGDPSTPCRITSLTVTAAGALAAVAGTEGADFSETRGAAGGPPYIPVGSIEIGQVRLADTAAAPVGPIGVEIFTVVGTHVERSDYPVNQVDFGRSLVTFAEALPAIHTGDLPKAVYLKGATPLFAPIPNSRDWTPAEATYSISSVDTYDGPIGSSSSSLSQASFTAVLRDGISDGFLAQKGKNIWIEFRPDRDKTVPKQLTQGILGISRSFPAGGGQIEASCTLTPQVESVDVAA